MKHIRSLFAVAVLLFQLHNYSFSQSGNYLVKNFEKSIFNTEKKVWVKLVSKVTNYNMTIRGGKLTAFTANPFVVKLDMESMKSIVEEGYQGLSWDGIKRSTDPSVDDGIGVKLQSIYYPKTKKMYVYIFYELQNNTYNETYEVQEVN